MADFLKDLNEPQQQAVQSTEGPVIIIAGAGSGKTRVLTYRIAYLLTQGKDPFSILALTFTNKAAREMKSRIGTLVGEEAKNLWMGTFHSVFAKMLRIEGSRLGYPSNFTIYDTDDSRSLMRDILRQEQIDDKIYRPNYVLNRISSAKNNLFSYQDYQDNVELVNQDNMAGKGKIGMLFEKYVKRCFKAGAMDFDDLLYNTYVLLSKFPDVLHKYQNKFKYLLVDEFQDTNFAQYVIVKKLAAQHENICVVGDDAQSIYAFRGATILNILNFEKDYPDLGTYKLEQNYRSTKNIVGAANDVIANNQEQLRKEIWTDNVEGEKVKLLRAVSDNEEGNMVASAIFQEKMNKQLFNKDFAILYRTNAQSRSMEEGLRKLGIPYRVFGGVSFYQRKEIKDLLAYFRLTINHNDEEALKRVINYPKREIGATTLNKLIVAADENDRSLWQMIDDVYSCPAAISSRARTKIAGFVSMIKSFAVQLKTQSAYDLASHIASSTGLLKELYSDKTPEGLSRYENIQELLNGIKEFTDEGVYALENPSSELEANEGRTLDIYMQDIALLTDSDGQKDDGDNDKVSMMTVHAAKGLEFKNVFVVGIEENLFPSQMSMNSREDLEEERRLFYVAMTRAEEKLYLSYATSRYRWGNLISCEPSRFIDEIGDQYIDKPTERVVPDTTHLNNWSNFGNNRSTAYRDAVRKRKQSKPKAAAPVPSNLKKLNKAKREAPLDFDGDDVSKIVVGMSVEHHRFGPGKVINMEGQYPNNKATIVFDKQGQKQLLLKYAKLKIIG